MKKLKAIFLFAILFLGLIANVQAQHYKKDGTPDMRYKENKQQYQSTQYQYQSTQTTQQTNPNVIHVEGYQKSNSTYVQPHDRTAPNETNHDNWSTKPNVNPETGKKGTKEPD
jgi:hypothetical protein